MHNELPANCAQNVEPGLAPGYEPKIPDDPEKLREEGFTFLGFGACRDANQQYPPWGSSTGTNKQCAAKCNSYKECLAYMSTQNEEPGEVSCQYYCTVKSTLCPEA